MLVVRKQLLKKDVKEQFGLMVFQLNHTAKTIKSSSILRTILGGRFAVIGIIINVYQKVIFLVIQYNQNFFRLEVTLE